MRWPLAAATKNSLTHLQLQPLTVTWNSQLHGTDHVCGSAPRRPPTVTAVRGASLNRRRWRPESFTGWAVAWDGLRAAGPGRPDASSCGAGRGRRTSPRRALVSPCGVFACVGACVCPAWANVKLARYLLACRARPSASSCTRPRCVINALLPADLRFKLRVFAGGGEITQVSVIFSYWARRTLQGQSGDCYFMLFWSWCLSLSLCIIVIVYFIIVSVLLVVFSIICTIQIVQ